VISAALIIGGFFFGHGPNQAIRSIAVLPLQNLSRDPEQDYFAESARDLFYTAGDSAEEGESLDDAMCILHALRNSLKHRPTAIQQ